MIMRLLPLSLAVLASGCVVPLDLATLADDTDLTNETDTEDTDVVDTDAGDTDETQRPDTGLGSGSDTDDTDQTQDLPPLDCHPIDPISYHPYSRTYTKRFGQTRGTEVHTSLGIDAVPGVVAGIVSQGFALEVDIRNAGNYNSTTTYYQVCDPLSFGDGAFEIGYVAESGGNTLKAGAQVPNKYLPEESELFAFFPPAWQEDVAYDIRIPTTHPFCGSGSVLAQRLVDAQYAAFPMDQVFVAPLGGNVDAFRINVILNQTQIDQGTTYSNPFCTFLPDEFLDLLNPFELFFGLLGFNSDDGSFITASIDRWYVRGVGLVREEATDYLTAEELYTSELSGCSGLPNCP